jgi:glutathione synthase/RimK-type ligase-like ATP-grasp enzyme
MKIYSMVAQTRQHLRKEGTTPDDLYSQLERRGYQVDIGYAEDFLLPLNRLKVEYDLYILKSHDDLWLSLASILHSMEANIVNPYPSCVVSENKIVATQRMQCAGIPVPDTWITANFDHLRKLVAKQPLLIKPHIGGMGRSELIRRVNTEQELTKILPPCDTYFVQAYVSRACRRIKH